MKKGRKNKPTNLRVLEGNPGKRPLPKDEPKPLDTSKPNPPSHLDKYGLEEWNRVCDGLHAMGVLFSIDMAILAAYCVSYSRWKQAEEELGKIRKRGSKLKALIQKTHHGNMIPHPLVGVSNTAARDVLRYAAQLGITPAARAGLGVKPKTGEKSKFAGLIKNA